MQVPIESIFEELKATVAEYQETLPEDRVCVLSASGMRVHKVAYLSPSLISYHCITEAGETVLIQHISQTNLVIGSELKKTDVPDRRIGFVGLER